MKRSVLFLCTGNSCRSQMAEGWLRYLARDRFDVASAGTHPVGINPMAVEVMKEVGVDISQHHSKSIEEFKDHAFDVVITVCDQAKAQFHTMMVGLKNSNIDIGAEIELQGKETQADAIARAVVRDEARLVLRRHMIGRNNESRGHLDCRGLLLSEKSYIPSVPELTADNAPRAPCPMKLP